MRNKSQLYRCGFVYFISAAAFLALKLAASLKAFNFMGNAGQYIVNAFIQIGLIFVLPFFLFKTLSRKSARQVFEFTRFNSRPSGRTILYSFLLGIVVFFGVNLIVIITQAVFGIVGYKNPFSGGSDLTGWQGFLLSVVLSCVLPALCEEFLNRGLFMHGASAMGARRALVYSSVLFSLMHFNINQAVFAFAVGLVLGFLVYITESIWPAVIVHFVNNFLSTFMSFLAEPQNLGSRVDTALAVVFGGNLFTALIKLFIYVFIAISLLSAIIIKIYKIEKPRQISRSLAAAAQVLNKTAEKNSKLAPAQEVFMEEPDLRNSKLVVGLMLPKDKADKSRLAPMEMFWAFSAVVLTALGTFFTFVWGLL